MKKRLFLVVAVVSGLVGLAPAAHAAGGCGRATQSEFGASDIVQLAPSGAGKSLALYEDNFNGGLLPAPYTADDTYDPRVTVRAALAAPSCADITYNVTVSDDVAGTAVLASATVTGTGADLLTLLDNVSIATPTTDTVYVVVWTSSARRPLLDRAPDAGANAATDGASGGQGWN